MSCANINARNALVNWQNAPAEHEIANYDSFQESYMTEVKNLIDALPVKSVKKKPFFTIAVNVLCADIHTSSESIDPIDRDLYLPLEITLTKWSIADGKNSMEERGLLSHTWMINPGRPPRNCNCYALEHRAKHKIDFDPDDSDDTYMQRDLNKVMKEINSFLGPDRTVYSIALENCRQDLGSLKWLNRETGYKSKPIKVYALEDLFVAIVRRLKPKCPEYWGRGLARYKMRINVDCVNERLMCDYHKTKASCDSGDYCEHCASALSLSRSHVMINTIIEAVDPFAETKEAVGPNTQGA